MTGTIVTPDELHIAGHVEGNVRAASITVRASGVITGDLVAETVIIHGSVDGRIFGQRVQSPPALLFAETSCTARLA